MIVLHAARDLVVSVIACLPHQVKPYCIPDQVRNKGRSLLGVTAPVTDNTVVHSRAHFDTLAIATI